MKQTATDGVVLPMLNYFDPATDLGNTALYKTESVTSVQGKYLS